MRKLDIMKGLSLNYICEVYADASSQNIEMDCDNFFGEYVTEEADNEFTTILEKKLNQNYPSPF